VNANTLALRDFDPDLQRALDDELQRQEKHMELIASEKYASQRVLQAQGSVLTSKYAEGYPGKGYYGGCEFVDAIEQLAIDRARRLFGADHVNVQRSPTEDSRLSLGAPTITYSCSTCAIAT